MKRRAGWLQATVTVTLAGQVVNTTAAQAARLGDQLSAVEACVIEWGRPHPHGHDAPGSITLVLRLDRPGAVALDDEVLIHALPQGWPVGNRMLVGQGWVESVEYDRVPESAVWRYVVRCQTWAGRADAARLSAAPWPADQELSERLQAINAASPYPIVDPIHAAGSIGLSVPLAARDVDNANALEVLQVTANTWGLLVQESRYGMLLYTPAGHEWFMPRLSTVSPRVELDVAPQQHSELPARALARTPRRLDRSGYLTDVVVNFQLFDSTTGETSDASRRWRAPGASGHAGSQLTIDTDYQVAFTPDYPIDPAAAYLGPAGTRAEALTATPAAARPVLEAGRVLLDRLDVGRVSLLAGTAYRSVATWLVTECPPDLDPVVTVLTGRLTIEAGWMGLEVELAPMILAGVRPLMWSDFPDDSLPPATIQGDLVPATFAHTDYASSGSPRPRFSHTKLTIAKTWRPAP